mmetsp:Transcript_14515/g.34991  ORF Transcript_14515/g.34991 Transcript_14515/m.34991 type:complete len:208 (+) Transcript_14515:1458-2081(+)
MLVPVRPLVQERDAQLRPAAIGAGFLPHQIFQISGAMRPARPGPQTDLNRRQNRRLAGAVLAVNEVDVATELHGELAMAHEIFDVHLVDDSRLGGLSGGIGVPLSHGGAVRRGGFCGSFLLGTFGGGGRGLFVVVVFLGVVVIWVLVLVIGGGCGFALSTLAATFATIRFVLLISSNIDPFFIGFLLGGDLGHLGGTLSSFRRGGHG